jgi:hypothetical protein
MINYNDYYVNLNFNDLDLIKEINEFIFDNQHKFFISRLGQNRIDFDIKLINKIREICPFFVSDAGIFKNPPGWVYPVHKDSRRQFAMNLLLSDPDPDFEVNFYSEDLSTKFLIPYVKNKWVLINTKKFHGVKNNSSTKDRYTISVGCISKTYHEIIEVFQASNRIESN